MTSLSVLVPVYDEQHLVAASLARLEVLAASPDLSRVQVVVVDDCSTDATPEVLRRFEAERAGRPGKLEWVFLRHARNGGKGRAIRTALARADCEISVIHDADLEYHPSDLLKMIRLFEEERADAVFGSRFAGGESRRVLFFRHELGNRLLTFLTNLVTDLNVSDMETCYKAVRTDLLKSIPLVSNDFRLEPELTIKLAKRGARLFEVPIRYSGRTYQEGKKIGWRDGAKALVAIARFAASGDVRTGGAWSRARRWDAWTAELVRPWVGQRVLELGSGSGALTHHLAPRERYVATDPDPLHVRALEALEADRPYLRAQRCDVSRAESFPAEGGFDTVVGLRVLGHVADDLAALRNIRAALAPGGRALLLVPHLRALRSPSGPSRRYDETGLRALAAEAGFGVRELVPFNRAGTAAWALGGKLLGRAATDPGGAALLSAVTPVLRKVDRRLPLPPLTLLAILERPADARA